MSSASSQIRLLLVEDVPQVAQYIRSLLEGQSSITLLDVVTDGRKAIEQAKQLRPDVLVVDALLQGRVKGLDIGPALRAEAVDLPIVALTVPQSPVQPDPARGVLKVLTMPFGGNELVHQVRSAYEEHGAAGFAATSRTYSVFAPKGGVGKTTIAFNLAVAFHQSGGQKTALIDGNLQFGDLRALLKVPVTAPSIVDLPTDHVQESDLEAVMWRDPSGIDILLAPPRVEMAEMITARDIGKLLGVLRKIYNVVVIDTPTAINDIVLAYLDPSDAIIEVVTHDSTTLYNARSIAATFQAIGYPADKVRYLVNRADSTGGADVRAVGQALGRAPEFAIVTDLRLVAGSNEQGVPFVIAAPDAPVSRDVVRIAAALVPEGTRVGAGGRR